MFKMFQVLFQVLHLSSKDGLAFFIFIFWKGFAVVVLALPVPLSALAAKRMQTHLYLCKFLQQI